MRVSYEWLKSMIDIPADPAELVAEYVRTGTEVEAVEKVGADLYNVVTGQVLTKEAHPNSDHMWLCQVLVGKKNVDEKGEPAPLQIVCGAQNFEAGAHVVVALVGAKLPGDITIKKSKLRGIYSNGMICSQRELGIGNDHSGIWVLPDDTPLGLDFADWYGLSDTVIDCELTPNRPDCLSMVGMAVETSAVLDRDTHIELPHVAHEADEKSADLVDVRIEDETLCPRYTARVLRNVKIGPSPEWLARRVTAAGARPINNVVDVANYVMFLTGQPLHTFDYDKLSERDGKRHIVVRAARPGEHLVTLDGRDRALDSDTILITDDEKTPICLAGVMGGENSEIDENTTNVLLESAVFAHGNISRTSRRLDLMSEASIRYERQVDASRCAEVSDIAAALFEECCGAEVCAGLVDAYPVPVTAPVVKLRPARVRLLAGAPIDEDFMVARLERLGCQVDTTDPASFKVQTPTNRPDLTREVDLIEEICRLWGEGEIEPTLPAARNHAGGLSVDQQRERLIGATLRACGLSETSTYCFAASDDLAKLGMSEEGRGIPVQIMNPLVADQAEMRRSMIPALLRSVAYNLDHGTPNVQLYEIGRVFYGHPKKSAPSEPSQVAGVMCGQWKLDEWDSKYAPLDFFDAKGVIEQLLAALRITKIRFKVADPKTYGWLQPGRAAEVFSGGEVLGWVGNIHPLALRRFDIDVPVLAFELSEDALLRLAQRELPYEEVPTLPGVSVDLALVVDEAVTAEQVMQRLHSAGGKLLRDVHLFDVYRDEQHVGAGKKSMAFSLTYRADDHTLTSDEVEKAHNKLVTKVTRSTGGEVRS